MKVKIVFKIKVRNCPEVACFTKDGNIDFLPTEGMIFANLCKCGLTCGFVRRFEWNMQEEFLFIYLEQNSAPRCFNDLKNKMLIAGWDIEHDPTQQNDG